MSKRWVYFVSYRAQNPPVAKAYERPSIAWGNSEMIADAPMESYKSVRNMADAIAASFAEDQPLLAGGSVNIISFQLLRTES